MKYAFLIAVALLGFAGVVSAQGKSYEIVNYVGKGPGFTLRFTFADGYPGASHIKLTESASGKTTIFKMEGPDEMRFVPEEGDDGTRSISLKMDAHGEPPETLAGTYSVSGKKVPLTFEKQ